MKDCVIVDVGNPAEFFACCGLLELADIESPGTLSCFRGNEFHLDADIATIIDNVVNSTVEKVAAAATINQASLDATDDYGDCPLDVTFKNGTKFHLNWWHTSSKLKCWATGKKGVNNIYHIVQTGNASSRSILDVAREVYRASEYQECLSVSYRKMKHLAINPRTAYVAADVGFRMDVESPYFPLTELLALFGLQRFQISGVTIDDVIKYQYYVWTVPLSASVAIAAKYCDPSSQGFFFHRVGRSANSSFFTWSERMKDV
jgi:CRISPR-associated protein Csx14